MSVFDEQGHVEIDSFETMCTVMKELYEAAPTKWRGNVIAMETSAGPGYGLEMNQTQVPVGAPGGFTAFFTDHVIKLGFGVVIKMTAAEYSAGQQNAGGEA